MKYDIKNLTLDEKLHLLTGQDNWRLSTANGKLPEIFVSDGPNGLRMHDVHAEGFPTKKATAMPCIHVIANTWNRELAYLDGATIADDCIENGADVLLAPGVNIKRTPLCGRNFEYFSEDPFLAGTLAKAYIEGLQDKGVGTSLKHYCANNREYDRFYTSSEVDERTLREIYLPAFEIAIEAQPWTVMCSYNPINGVYASENKWLLDDVLRGEFGFEGIVLSDWGATHQSARAAKAGLDVTMPFHPKAFEELKEAYESGYLTIQEIDRNVSRILRFIEKANQEKQPVTTTKAQRHENALKIAREGIVLLKNEDDILPLKGGNIFAFGAGHNAPPMGGNGSALVQTEFNPSPIAELLKERLGDSVNTYKVDTGVSMDLTDGFFDITWNLTQAYRLARKADVIVYYMSNTRFSEGECWDRPSLKLPQAQVDVLHNLAKYNKNIVAVVHAGSAIDVSEWIDEVKAVVYVGFAGEAGAEATADILTGKVCPSGKLAETFPVNLENTGVGKYVGNGFVDRYDEGVFVGYRYYDSFEKEVAFPFGYGLSYAEFEYSDLRLDKKSETDYEVSFTVKNISNVDGKETAQLYVRDVFSAVSRPDKELKGFEKIALKAGESKRVQLTLNARSFAYYSIPRKSWYVENGEFEILVGASSRDIRLSQSIEINLPFETQVSENYFDGTKEKR